MRREYAELEHLIGNGRAAFELFRKEMIVCRNDFKYVLGGMDDRLRKLEEMVLPEADHGNADLGDTHRHDIYEDPDFDSYEAPDDMEEERFSEAFASFCDDY